MVEILIGRFYRNDVTANHHEGPKSWFVLDAVRGEMVNNAQEIFNTSFSNPWIILNKSSHSHSDTLLLHSLLYILTVLDTF